MRVLVPFDARAPKTRLSPLLTDDERRDFATAMCRDVLRALDGHEVTLVATTAVDAPVPVEVDDRPLSAAVNARLAGETAVVMADLALATPESIDRLFATAGDVVAAPGRGGGTNALVVRHPEFATDYHGVSFRDHRRAARAVGADFRTVDSFRLASDIDEPSDLADLLLHGTGAARDYLVERGIELGVRDGRAVAVREGESF
ncbi:2-phospho-L-lactate guanylyltransferase [Natronomonas sp. EA1]|uniref:2-phospho-L-lactate guanylyltransferase n=1 Tax=Natronomonas sp. EA1 TaxID=3421655 RepID=UPI003EB7F633